MKWDKVSEFSLVSSTVRILWMIHLLLLSALTRGFASEPRPPLVVTHFFDWYSPATPPEQFTHRIEWENYGLQTADIGSTPKYYLQQFELIEDTGFDAIVYEWYGIQPKPMVLEQLAKTSLEIGIFYDLAIRFHNQTPLQPVAEDAKRLISDVLSFYQRIPVERWLVDADGRLNMVFYAFPFDLSEYRAEPWNNFFTTLAEGLEEGLNAQIRVYWTGLHNIPAMHGLLHFEEFSPLNFNPFEGQTQIDADSVCWAFNYDDRGAVIQGRRDRLIQKDPAYLQEGFDLALRSHPKLVFNYGWNEFFEGENIMPDATYVDFRRQTIQNMIQVLRETESPEMPSALVIVDDLLPAWRNEDGSAEPWIELESRILYLVRRVLPQADVRITGSLSFAEVSAYDILVGLNQQKSATEDRWLADLAPTRKVLYLQPATRPATGMTQLFSSEPRTSIFGSSGPVSPNEFVVLQRSIDADLQTCPMIHFRVRNTPGSNYHIRLYGTDASGQQRIAWLEDSPLDDENTIGLWEERRVDAAQIAQQAAGVPIQRITAIEIILDDGDNGLHHLDLDFIYFESRNGETLCWRDEFNGTSSWSLSAGSNVPPADRDFSVMTEDATKFGRITMLADDPKTLPANVGEDQGILLEVGDHIQKIAPLPEVEIWATLDWENDTIPLLLARQDDVWINCYSENADRLWEEVFRRWTGEKGNAAAKYGVMNAVLMKDFLNAGEVTRIRDLRWSRIHPELLPIAPQPPMPIAGFYPPAMTFTEGETVSINWTAGGLDADSIISHYEYALDPVVDGMPGGVFKPVAVENLDDFGGGKITIPRPEDGEYEVWIRAVDDQGTTGFLQESFHLKVDTQRPPQPHSIQLIEETETRLNIEAVFPEDPTSGLAFMKYALGSGSSDPAELPWTSLFSWNAEDPGASIGDLWVQPRMYADGAWTMETGFGRTAIRPDTYLYVFWNDAHYNGKELDLFIQAWSPQPNLVGIWYVELPGGPEYFRFTDPVAVPLREEWGWVRLPVPAHSGDGNGADLARLQGFESGLLIAGMTARLRDGRVRFSCPRPDPYQTGIWVQSVDAAGWPSDPGFLRWPWANSSTSWGLH